LHHFEGKQLIREFIPDTLVGIEFLWGGEVHLETIEIVKKRIVEDEGERYFQRKVLYTMKDRKIEKIKLEE
jgi:stage V sporulation protein R